MNPTAIIGLGNPLMSDEGIGNYIIGQIIERSLVPEAVDVIDMGTGGIAVLHELDGRDRVVFIDCVFMNEAPGTIRRFTPDEVVSTKVQPRLSLHEGDLLHILQLANDLGQCPETIILFGIQPERVEPGMSISQSLSDQLDHYLDVITAEITEAR